MTPYADAEEDKKRKRRCGADQLDEDMERCGRKVEGWARKMEGSERDSQPQSGKAWSPEGECDETDAGVDENSNLTSAAARRDEVDEEIDPLDAFMNNKVLPLLERPRSEPPASGDMNMSLNISTGRSISAGEDCDSEDEDDVEFVRRVKKTKAEKLASFDHSKIEYPPFRKNFYIEAKEISRMNREEVSAYRKQLEVKIEPKDAPKPVKAWCQTGLSTKILETIKKLNCEKPKPIQAQALPVIMSGRDCIGLTQTGSGKTLAFVLPMLRHIKNQAPLMPGDGPIGLVIAPTRELVTQIDSVVKKFAKVLGLCCVAVYGGSCVAKQISELRRGVEIVVCTPGRMIDLLSGKVTNLRRVTYLVLDEADRMFDEGFGPQITMIIQNTRPDRQTLLFAATFPSEIGILARKVLNAPVEIRVGRTSVVNKDISQFVEVRPQSDKFHRLLEIMMEWHEKGKILIFVKTHLQCDALVQDLLEHGYPSLSLHGGKNQSDRESAIADFRRNVCNLMVATSVASRGLDVKEIELVINFDVPNHYEDYVHRVGRTGRAGRKGCAITFVSHDDDKYASDIVKALELSDQLVPDDLRALADCFMAKVNQGLARINGIGYGGTGFEFNELEDEMVRVAKQAKAEEYELEKDSSDLEDDDVDEALDSGFRFVSKLFR